MKKIIAFSGSNSRNSINQKLVEALKGYVKNSEIEVLSLRDYPAEIYNEDLEIEEGIPEKMIALGEKMDAADGFVVSTPEHNGSMTAVLKNTIDWQSRLNPMVFREKPTVFLSTSPGPRGGKTALEHLVKTMPYRGADIVGHYSLGNFKEHYSEEGLSEEAGMAVKNVIAKLEERLTT